MGRGNLYIVNYLVIDNTSTLLLTYIFIKLNLTHFQYFKQGHLFPTKSPEIIYSYRSYFGNSVISAFSHNKKQVKKQERVKQGLNKRKDKKVIKRKREGEKQRVCIPLSLGDLVFLDYHVVRVVPVTQIIRV